MSQLYESINDVFSLPPVKLYKHDLDGSKINVALHWHRSIELTINLTGRIQFITGSNNLIMTESEWVIVNSGEPHACQYINQTDHFSGISLVISLDFVEKWMGKDLFFYNPQNNLLSAKFKSIATELYFKNTEAPDFSLFLMSKLYEIMYLLSQNCIRPKDLSDFKDKNMQHAIMFTDYIEKHYQEDINLHSVADHFKYSEAYFSRLFKKSLGVNLLTYINYVRASHAAEELAGSKISLTDCALNNGFPNTKSFINAFKKIYGCTPSNYISGK